MILPAVRAHDRGVNGMVRRLSARFFVFPIMDFSPGEKQTGRQCFSTFMLYST